MVTLVPVQPVDEPQIDRRGVPRTVLGALPLLVTTRHPDWSNRELTGPVRSGKDGPMFSCSSFLCSPEGLQTVTLLLPC